MAKPLDLMSERRRRDDSERARRSEALIDSATRAFARNGFEAATTRQIAAEAGCSEGLIHRYFGGKAGLLDAVLGDVADSVVGSLALEARDHGEDAVQHAMAAALRAVDGQRDGVRLLFLRALTDSGTAQLLSGLRERYVSQLVTVIAPAGDDRSSLDRAQVVADLMVGLTLLRVVAGGSTDDGAAARAARILTAPH